MQPNVIIIAWRCPDFNPTIISKTQSDDLLAFLMRQANSVGRKETGLKNTDSGARFSRIGCYE